MTREKKVTVYCIIEAPNDLVRDQANAERVAKVMVFEKKPRRDGGGEYHSFAFSLNEDEATTISCEILRFERIHTPTFSLCTHVTWLRLVNPQDFVKVCAMDNWKKIPVITPEKPVSEPTEESPGSPDELFYAMVMDRG